MVHTPDFEGGRQDKIANESYVCGVCGKAILPGMRFEYAIKEFKDREGHSATRTTKAHIRCIRADTRAHRDK